jgi:hypothetical protein
MLCEEIVFLVIDLCQSFSKIQSYKRIFDLLILKAQTIIVRLFHYLFLKRDIMWMLVVAFQVSNKNFTLD